MSQEHKFPYIWTLKDANFTKDKGKVFSCFACGGGSTMGYKLAGFDVIGAMDIDPKMMEVYRANHNPKYSFVESITTFKDREDLPEELFDLDILDGSPPCSSFSLAGRRQKQWGEKKVFREGQSEQVLDTLFFDFIDLAKRLKPKVVVAENVEGIIQGEALPYANQILEDLYNAGYKATYRLVNAEDMGVPQRRKRVFFCAIREDLDVNCTDLFGEVPEIDLDFRESPIVFGEFKEPPGTERATDGGKEYERVWAMRSKSDGKMADTTMRVEGISKFFTVRYVHTDRVCPTYASNSWCLYLFDEWGKPTEHESKCINTFPQDFEFLDQKYFYIMGMSVPPIMAAQVASRIWKQWLGGSNEG